MLLQEKVFYYKEDKDHSLNDAIIQAQVQVFDEICQKNHKGNYIVEGEINLIHAIK